VIPKAYIILLSNRINFLSSETFYYPVQAKHKPPSLLEENKVIFAWSLQPTVF